MKNILYLFLLIISIPAIADNLKTSDSKYPFNYGKIEDSTYTNPFFKFSISIPSTWTIQNKTQIDFVISKGKDIVQFDDDAINKAIDKIDVNSMTLLMVSKYEIGAPVIFNPNLIVMAENILTYPGIKKGNDYLYHVGNGLKKSTLNYECTEIEEIFNVDHINFYGIECQRAASTAQILYYTSIIKKYAFSFIVTFSNETEKEELLSIIKTTVFQK